MHVVDEKGKLYVAEPGVREDLFEDLKMNNPTKEIKVTDMKGRVKYLPIYKLTLYAIYRNTTGLNRG